MIPENAIPAGSMPPKPEEAQGKAADQGGKGTEGGGESLILGKFKSADEVVPAYQELEKDHGRLKNEVGALRKQNETMLDLVSKTVQQPGAAQGGGQGAQQEPAPDHDKLLEETITAVEQGEMNIGEGLRKVHDLTTKKVVAMAQETITKIESDRSAKSQVEKFQAEHPDFQEALQSGALDQIKRTNSMHDNFSAYFEWKLGQTQAQAEQQVKEAYEKGKADISALAAGADATKRVLGKSGSEARMTNAPAGPTTEAEKISGMMGVLRAARAG